MGNLGASQSNKFYVTGVVNKFDSSSNMLEHSAKKARPNTEVGRRRNTVKHNATTDISSTADMTGESPDPQVTATS